MSESDDRSAGSEASPSSERPAQPSAGARLTAERRNQGLSLGDVARQLKLSVRQVEALERDDYASFAGPVFVRGFLRNYAKLLELDPEDLAAAATPPPPAPSPVAVEVEELNHPANNPERSRRVLTSVVIVALVIAAIVLLSSKLAHEQHPPAPGSDAATTQAPAAGRVAQLETPALTAAPPVDASTAQPTPAGATPQDPAASNVAAAGTQSSAADSSAPSAAAESAPKTPLLVSGNGPAQVHMVFEGESWVEVKDASGTTIFSRLNSAGSERVIKGTPPLTLVVGNARSVKLMYHEKQVDLQPHTRVDVARITLE